MNPEEQSKQGLETVRRAIALLRCFSSEELELGVTELSRRLGVHKSTVSRLLGTLERERLIHRNDENGRYRLGVGLIELAGLAALSLDMRRIAQPHLNELSKQTQETVTLAVPEGQDMVCIDLVLPTGRRIASSGWVGRRAPWHATSTGKVFAAHADAGEMDLLLAKPLEPCTEQTLTEPGGLRAAFEAIRTLGYATEYEELELGMNAAAAPVCDHTGQVIAAVGVAGPSYRLTRDKIESNAAELVIACGKRISHAMGCQTAGSVD
ncbi:MAG: IclR family transcriptional regulator [Anaerolineales bacterium]|jgi:DNA-binding IclR family transcriptional regulator